MSFFFFSLYTSQPRTTSFFWLHRPQNLKSYLILNLPAYPVRSTVRTYSTTSPHFSISSCYNLHPHVEFCHSHLTGLPVLSLSPYQSEVLLIQSCPALCNPMDCSLAGSSSLMEFSRQEYWSGLPFPFPGDPPDPGIESPDLPYCRQILYHMSHQGSPLHYGKEK